MLTALMTFELWHPPERESESKPNVAEAGNGSVGLPQSESGRHKGGRKPFCGSTTLASDFGGNWQRRELQRGLRFRWGDPFWPMQSWGV